MDQLYDLMPGYKLTLTVGTSRLLGLTTLALVILLTALPVSYAIKDYEGFNWL